MSRRHWVLLKFNRQSIKHLLRLLGLALYLENGRSPTLGSCTKVFLSRRRTSLYKHLKIFKNQVWLHNGVRVLESKNYPQVGDRYERSVAPGRTIPQTDRLEELYNISQDGLPRPFPSAATGLTKSKSRPLESILSHHFTRSSRQDT